MKQPVVTRSIGILGILAIAYITNTAPASSEVGDLDPTIERRISELEQRVRELERRLGQESSGSGRTPTMGIEPTLPTAVRSTLDQLHPGAQVIESGRDVEDGYWWFEVRRNGQLFDVEIGNDGQVWQNRRIAD